MKKSIKEVSLELETLRETCKSLLDDVNSRFPDKDPLTWKCPYYAKIAKLINYSVYSDSEKEYIERRHNDGYDTMSPRDQWDYDKRNGMLDL